MKNPYQNQSKQSMSIQISLHSVPSNFMTFSKLNALFVLKNYQMPKYQGMRWRHAWIIKRRTFWSLLFQHLPRSFQPWKTAPGRYTQLPTALGRGTWCVWSKRKQQCHPLWCKDLESWESMENRKTNWKDRWHTHTRHSRVCLGLALKTKKPPNLGVAPFSFL